MNERIFSAAELETMQAILSEEADGTTLVVFPEMSVRRTPGIFERLAAGCHDGSRDSDASAEHFPIEEDGEVDVFEPVLMCVGQRLASDAVIACSESHGLLCPDPEHTLAFGNEYPDIQKQGDIVALGKWRSRSVWVRKGRDSFVLVLTRSLNKRYRKLGLRFEGIVWPCDKWFLFIRRRKRA